MSQKLVRIATPKQVQRFASYGYLGDEEHRLADVRDLLREERLPIQTIDHVLIHYPAKRWIGMIQQQEPTYRTDVISEDAIFFDTWRGRNDSIGLEAALREMASLYVAEYPGKKLALTSPQAYERVEAVFREIGYEVRRINPRKRTRNRIHTEKVA